MKNLLNGGDGSFSEPPRDEFSNDYAEKTYVERDVDTVGEEYYELPEDRRSRSLIWSILSVSLSALSVLLCAFWYVSLPIALSGIIFSIVSFRKFKYFDTMSVLGLILGIVGVVFGIGSIVLDFTGVADAFREK